MLTQQYAEEALCFPVVRPAVRPTNIHHISAHCCKGYSRSDVRCQRSWPVQLT